MNDYDINKILTEKTITSYLEDNDIFPIKESGGKFFYLCPIHKTDKVPSFIVYDVEVSKKPYQTYYCYGCHSGINLLNLVKDLHDLDFYKSVNFLTKNTKIDSQSICCSITEDILNNKDDSIFGTNEFEEKFLMVNTLCRDYLAKYNDDEEIYFFEKFFEKLDKNSQSKNIEDLNKILNKLLFDGFKKRSDEFAKREKYRLLNAESWNVV